MTKVAGIGALSLAGIAGACGGGYLLMKKKTIGDRISKEGLSLIRSGDSYAWKLAAKHLKLSDEALVSDLSKFDAEIKSKDSMDLDKTKVALEKWCKEAINKNLSDQNIKDYLKKAKSRCVTPPSDIRDKLNREGKVLATNWNNKFEALKTQHTQDSDLKSHLTAIDNTITEEVSSANTQKDKYSSALEKWCKTKLEVKIESNDYETFYSKVISRCTEAQPLNS
ncbi:hypothetical protein MHC_00765 [Mycoplasma haemocanis str. Illinois]|uniref:Lipoprotein n=1 Tax=Mycoplasma haemocanis (strain Illinois) TaxID=1111676 RepID=H6N5Q9_MYCHN|nr:hypothetical protein [Mycoplasma haemocanis]AEW45019.1 hypothetical protein MHC_00765 [Mycoplasma haemocanis str. Illinois]